MPNYNPVAFPTLAPQSVLGATSFGKRRRPYQAPGINVGETALNTAQNLGPTQSPVTATGPKMPAMGQITPQEAMGYGLRNVRPLSGVLRVSPQEQEAMRQMRVSKAMGNALPPRERENILGQERARVAGIQQQVEHQRVMEREGEARRGALDLARTEWGARESIAGAETGAARDVAERRARAEEVKGYYGAVGGAAAARESALGNVGAQMVQGETARDVARITGGSRELSSYYDALARNVSRGQGTDKERLDALQHFRKEQALLESELRAGKQKKLKEDRLAEIQAALEAAKTKVSQLESSRPKRQQMAIPAPSEMRARR